MSQLQSWKGFWAPKLRPVVELLFSQGITMAGNLFYGFLCVRLLPIPDYAEYSVVFSVLGSLTMLMDIGFSGALLPLIGERIDDLGLIADYVASLRQLAHWLFFLAAPVTIVLFPLMVRHQHWSWQVVAGMLAILLVASWCARVAGAYGAVLIVRRDRGTWYRAQMISSLGTLALLGAAWALHGLNAFSAMLINVAGMVYLGLAYFFRARHLLKTPGHASRKKRREIVHLALPNAPMAIFYAFQGQISLFLITIFGYTSGVASVGALTRLAQIFALAAPMNLLLIEPYFAKLPKAHLKRNYMAAMAVLGGIGGSVVLLAWLFPGPFLWVLGPKYAGLRYELLLVMIASSLSYVGGTMAIIHNARKFVYWWNNMARIVLTILVLLIFLWKVNLSSVRGALMLSVAAAAAAVAVTILTGIYGFARGPREFKERDPQPPAHETAND